MAGEADGVDLDALGAAAFVEAVGPLFEWAPGFLWRLAAVRPRASWDAVFERARVLAHALPEPLQVELIDAHPRLGAPREAVSGMSFREQGYDRVDAGQEDLADRLERLNAEYEGRFGFRYCVFVAGRPREALLPGFEAALAAARDSELHRALDAVVDIAQDRYRTAHGKGRTA